MVRAEAPKPWEERYRHQGRLWGGDRLDAWTVEFLDAHPESVAADWLDAACGDGKGLVPLVRRLSTGRVVGVDLARQALRLIEGPAARSLLQGDLRALPCREGTFDVVRAVHAVGHLLASDRAVAWRALRAASKPSGRLVVVEFGVGDMRASKGEEVEPGTRRRPPGITTHHYSEEGLVAELVRAGWEVERSVVQRHPFAVRGVEHQRERVCVWARPEGSPPSAVVRTSSS